MVQFVERVLNSSTNTNTILTKLLYPDIKMVRISDTFSEPEYGTNMIEKDENKLKKLNELGRRSYAKFEQDIINLFNT